VVLPGGESTTLSLLLESSGLFDPLAKLLEDGLPVLGTCAGLVLLAREVQDGRPDQRSFARLDCAVRRNGYGRQRFSFEAPIEARQLSEITDQPDEPLPGVFIRAPVVVSVGPEVDVLARLGDEDGDPVVIRQGPVLGTAFHPELTADRRVHRLFAQLVAPAVPDAL
jgi:5'-phosphate synthase pdxT subunit